MKKMGIAILALVVLGCVTVRIPKYLEAEFPYRKTFAANFQDTFNATLKALNETGLKVTETTSPLVFGQDRASDKANKYEVLIFTEIDQSPLFLASNYTTLNALLKSTDATHTDVEIRYLSMLVLPFKSLKSYQNDRLVEKIFNKIEASLKK